MSTAHAIRWGVVDTVVYDLFPRSPVRLFNVLARIHVRTLASTASESTKTAVHGLFRAYCAGTLTPSGANAILGASTAQLFFAMDECAKTQPATLEAAMAFYNAIGKE